MLYMDSGSTLQDEPILRSSQNQSRVNTSIDNSINRGFSKASIGSPEPGSEVKSKSSYLKPHSSSKLAVSSKHPNRKSRVELSNQNIINMLDPGQF